MIKTKISVLLHGLSNILGFKHPINMYNIPIQKSNTKITYGELSVILNELIISVNKFDYKLSDNLFKLVDIETLKEFLIVNQVSKRKYVSEIHDCDDFEIILAGDLARWDSDLATGIIWGIKPNGIRHAWNLCIGTDNKIWFIEPQTDEVFLPTKYWKIDWIMI